MRQALHLAHGGRGRVEPNPMVGCVIVRDGQLLGQGFHHYFGGPHAEIDALTNCAASGNSPAGATAYVTLEPCCHLGKKTPPCVPKLIEARLARVVVGCLDPNPAVHGRGVAMLRAVGIEVTAPILEAESRQLIAPFLARIQLGRPYVTLKWAQTADGKIAGPGGQPLRISNPASTRAVHQLRAISDAILVGIGTVLADDPLLTVRGIEPLRPLRRIVLDSRLRIPIQSRLVQTARQWPLLVLTSRDRKGAVRPEPQVCQSLEKHLSIPSPSGRGQGEGFSQSAKRPEDREDPHPRPLPEGEGVSLSDFGVEVRSATTDDAGRLSLSAILSDLPGDVTHLLVEPGATLGRSFLQSGWVDRVWRIRSSSALGAADGVQAPDLPTDYIQSGEIDLSGDQLTEYLNPRSSAFFHVEASPEFRAIATITHPGSSLPARGPR